ncbi:MAG: translation initiation factor IF-2 subunit gamma [Nanobdellota archaeon]
MTDQPEINIGLVGHVDHGKTTLTERLSGRWTDTHSEELKRGITIRLGYANTSIWDVDGKLVADAKKPKGGKLKRSISFIDAPGHESLMATMLSGATVMDGAILMVSANEECPQPQTKEHLMALKIMGMKNVIVIQNKIDLVEEKKALENYKQIKEFLKDTPYKDAPIIPISAQHGANIDVLVDAIEEYLPTPERDLEKSPKMLTTRSFDINKPGSEIKDIQGGVIGGGVMQGKFKEGDEIEIKPGMKLEEKNQIVYKPVKTKIQSVYSGSKRIKEAIPGGSVGLKTSLDPAIVKSDSLSGSLIGHPGELPEVHYELKLKVHLLDRVVGTKEDIEVESIKPKEILMLNVNSTATVGVVYDISKEEIDCKLKLPVCAEKGARVTISRRMGNRFRLIGYGFIE